MKWLNKIIERYFDVDKLPRWFKRFFMTKLGLVVPTSIWSAIWLTVNYDAESNFGFWMASPALLYLIGGFFVLLGYAFKNTFGGK